MQVSKSEATQLLSDIQVLLKLSGANPFRVRAFEKAIDSLSELTEAQLEESVRLGNLTQLPGIGKGISDTLTEFFQTGKSQAREELRASLPKGLTELVRIPGLGPKKAKVLIDELQVQSLSELEYMCLENRLTQLKGFGVKAQEKILQGIRFLKSTEGKLLLLEAQELAAQAKAKCVELVPGIRIEETGSLRRQLEVVERIELLVAETHQRQKLEWAMKELDSRIQLKFSQSEESFEWEWLQTTGSEKHLSELIGKKKYSPQTLEKLNETEIYRSFGLGWIPPEMRETGEECEVNLDAVLPVGKIRGVFHNHTQRSDGKNTLEEMVLAAQRLGYEYLGISDHSQSSVIAGGLRWEDVQAQSDEVERLREKYPRFRIFWGIESDILKNGELDYSDQILEKFDFVIASVHARYQSDSKAMTERLIRAIQNPSTRMIGHLSGRLLLGREPYAFDVEQVLEMAARHQVAIEINAQPSRMDIDWRYGGLLRKYQVMTSINPDAHSVEGLKYTRLGEGIARKALLPSRLVLNTRSADEVSQWLERA